MSAEKKFVVGQEVVVIRGFGARRTPERQVVVKVGRTIVYTARAVDVTYPTDSFYMKDGRETGSYSQGHLYTLDEVADRERRKEALDRVEQAGHRSLVFSLDRYTTDQVERIAAILEEG